MSKELTPKPNQIRHLPARKASQELTRAGQLSLDLEVQKQVEVDSVGMGVLWNGTPFLTGRGLARLVGMENLHIRTIAQEWNDNPPKPRIERIKSTLASRGLTLDCPYIKTSAAGQVVHAYSDSVCLAVLEFYTFDAAQTREVARKNYRILAGKGLRDFIYTQVGYTQEAPELVVWRQFLDRVSLLHDSVPMGYFSIFKEIADVVVTLIQSGANVGPKFVPDQSVGQHWSQFWTENGLEAKYGARARYEHNYPDYFPQAASNPQDPYCYPNAALGAFREWMWEHYLPKHLPSYLKRQEAKGLLPAKASEKAVKAIHARPTPKRLPAA